ncbi:MerR family transcriptional regulator [Kribbella lupini]|jgi:DNA-binding transcriptional MerR regulator|uniref:MerR family transcriptional regulator n=1 Tax=Kribbella lupini TaxID=291602 RepID=A0ABP4L0Y3_9ACTN
MQIGDLAAEAGVTVKAVRYYESQGLLKPEREPNGYRRYSAEDVVIVREVKALLSLGLTAEQTYPFIECLRAGNDRADVCPASLSAYRLRIAEVDRRIAELTDLRGKLTGLLADAENWRRRSHAPADS